jgi:ABC-type nitrate/sulfonate/bicarbonate transport system substrate-binding protein
MRTLAINLLKRALCAIALLLLSVADVPAAELRKITFGYSTIGSQATGVWMAKEIGAFEKHGIHADLIYIASGPVVVQALIGGDLHGGIGASNAVVNAVLSGAPIVGVAATTNRPYHRLWVQPEINRLEDLRGKTLGVTRFGAVTDNLTRILLRKNGLENAVTIRQLGGTPEVGAAFQQRLIAGAVTAELRLGPNVPTKILLNLVDMGIPYSMNLIPVSSDFYKRNPEVVDGMVRAYTEGIAALNSQKERALKVIAKYSRLTEAKNIEDHYKDSVTYLERTPRAEPEAISTILEFIGKKGTPPETFVDNSVVDKMVREGFVDKLYQKR